MAEQQAETQEARIARLAEKVEFLSAFDRDFRAAMQADATDLKGKSEVTPTFAKPENLLEQPSGKAASVMARAIQERPDLTDVLLLNLLQIVKRFDATLLVHLVRALGGLMAERRKSTADDVNDSSKEKTTMLPAAIDEGTLDEITRMCQAAGGDEPATATPGSVEGE